MILIMMNVNKSLKWINVKLWLFVKIPVPFPKRTDKFILILVLWAYEKIGLLLPFHKTCDWRAAKLILCLYHGYVYEIKKVLITQLSDVWHCDLLSHYLNKAWPYPDIICGTSEQEHVSQDTCICLWACLFLKTSC